MDKLDFKSIADAALSAAKQLLSEWYPQGRFDGREMRCGDVQGGEGDSFSVNIVTGMWADFAGTEKGGDLISLYAARFGVSNLEAAKAIAGRLGMAVARDLGVYQSKAVAPAVVQIKPDSIERSARTPWCPVVPVPADAPAYPQAHIKRGKPEMQWEYRSYAGELLGVVYRFKTSDGGKEVLPCVYARNSETGREEWRWMQWAEPRPLYGLDRFGSGQWALLVEGEKCVDVFNSLALNINCVSWSGGSKAYAKADWPSLVPLVPSKKIVIWPDHDEPGMKAAEGIAKILARLGFEVRILAIPADKPEAWDVADAVLEDGWTPEQVRSFITEKVQAASSYVEQSPAPTGVTDTPPTADNAGAEPVSWDAQLIRNSEGVAKDVWHNVAYILQLHPALAGMVAYDCFSNKVVKRLTPPWVGGKQGEWTDQDDRELSFWIAAKCYLTIRSIETIGQAVMHVAKRNQFNPVENYLNGLVWDDFDRTAYWLHECVGAADNEYTRLVGKLFLRGMVKRAMHPGCKFDNSIILIGSQGLGKSTVWKILGGEWFADTPFKPGDKDSYMMVQGAWLYELSELEQFNRAESTAIKAFTASSTDRFRLPYGKRVEAVPRVCVFGGTTNNLEIFKDQTGNRRYWPVEIPPGSRPNLELLAEWRDQLFAQALHEVRAGERSYATPDESLRLIEPVCQNFEVSDAWAEAIEAFLSGNTRAEITTQEIMSEVLRLDLSALGTPRAAETRIGQAMNKLGWRKVRKVVGNRRYYAYVRPAQALVGVEAVDCIQEKEYADLPL
ncbi:VapE domain-containing protein [Parvibium lacunae]|uniref:VapE domain-containing protein n=1 Tax=Parvibium lacunae TaxID=1888893 RepID=UPI0013150183|nr:VapE domain-containing protein [Parvibium lacunae]